MNMNMYILTATLDVDKRTLDFTTEKHGDTSTGGEQMIRKHLSTLYNNSVEDDVNYGEGYAQSMMGMFKVENRVYTQEYYVVFGGTEEQDNESLKRYESMHLKSFQKTTDIEDDIEFAVTAVRSLTDIHLKHKMEVFGNIVKSKTRKGGK